MSERPTVAVVIPTKNGSAFIAETIESVLSQSLMPDDIVVVDDGSTDGTSEVVRRYPMVRLLQNPRSGANEARALGQAATSSELIAFLDHDDIWYEHHLEFLTPLHAQWPNVVATFGTSARFTTRPPPVAAAQHETEPVDPWAEFPTAVRPGTPSAVVIRRSALEAIGGWPRWHRTFTDTYVWLRLADVGTFLHWRGVTIAYRIHESMSWLARRDDLERAMAMRHAQFSDALGHHEKHGPTPAIFRVRLDLLARVDAVAAATWQGNTAALGRSLTELVEATEHLALEAHPDVLRTFSDELRRPMRDSPALRANFVRAYAGWPLQHREWRRQLADPLAPTVLLWSIRHSPMHPSRWGIPIVRGVHTLLRPVARRAVVVGRQRVRALVTSVCANVRSRRRRRYAR